MCYLRSFGRSPQKTVPCSLPSHTMSHLVSDWLWPSHTHTHIIFFCQDDDLRELRDTREWRDALSRMKGGLTEDQRVKLQSEVKVRGAGIIAGLHIF